MKHQTSNFQNSNFTSSHKLICQQQINDLREEIVNLTRMLQEEKMLRETSYDDLQIYINDIETKIRGKQQIKTKTSIMLSKSQLAKKNQIDEQQETIQIGKFIGNHFSQSIILDSIDNSSNYVRQDLNVMMKQFNQFKNSIQLQVAKLNDNFENIQYNLQQCLNIVGHKGNIQILIDKVIELQQKTNQLSNSSQKNVLNIEDLKDQIQYFSNKLGQFQNAFSKQSSINLNNYQKIRQQTQKYQTILSDTFELKLSKIIESYNMNFEDVDRSINQIKQFIADIVKLNKKINQNIGIKLNNTIDTQTFNQTIQELSDSLHSAYMISHQNLKLINQRDYQVQSELYEIRCSLDHFQNDCYFKQNKQIQYFQSEDIKGDTLDDLNTLQSQKIIGHQNNSIQYSMRRNIMFKTQKDKTYNLSLRKRISLADQLMFQQ